MDRFIPKTDLSYGRFDKKITIDDRNFPVCETHEQQHRNLRGKNYFYIHNKGNGVDITIITISLTGNPKITRNFIPSED